MTLGLQVDFVEVEGVPARVVGAYRAKAAVAEGDMPPVGVEGHFPVGLGKLGQRLHGDVFASLGHVVATVVLAGDAGVGADYKLVEFKFFGYHLLYLLQRGLLRLVAGEDDERQGMPSASMSSPICTIGLGRCSFDLPRRRMPSGRRG